ncbi:MAG: hypothetical protein Q4G48_07170 [Bacteroidia bacterium]|nr:hypothetical protein [Bacteroidia bacterium]
MSDKFQNKYRIPSSRAVFHDYNGGAYFVTVCTAGMECFFGKIWDDKMKYTEIGKYAVEQIENIASHYPYAEIPLFAVMPNHIHLIVFIDDIVPHHRRKDVARNVSTLGEPMSAISPKAGTLSVVIRGFKSAVTRYANQNNISFAWQSRYHDRIIRDRHEMNRIAEYIENNVINWATDKYNTLP